MSENKKRRITKKFIEAQLDELYSHELVSIGFALGKRSTYGEVLRYSADYMIELFSRKLSKSSVFYDLGSGMGKLASHVALKSKAKRVVGIELDKKRHKESLDLASKIDFPATQPEFINDDIFDTDFSDATIVYFDNTSYPDGSLEKIIELLPKGCLLIYKQGGAHIGDRFFRLDTTYGNPNATEHVESTLARFWLMHASYRYV